MAEKVLVYIDRTGGGCEVSTSAEAEVLELDFNQILGGEDPEVPEAFLEAFPFLRDNLERTRAEREDLVRRNIELPKVCPECHFQAVLGGEYCANHE